jgi:hypothetical protein
MRRATDRAALMNVLVLHDEAGTLESIADILRSLGHRVIGTSDTTEALDAVEHDVKPFDRRDISNAIHRALAANALRPPIVVTPTPELIPWPDTGRPIEHVDEDLSILASR